MPGPKLSLIGRFHCSTITDQLGNGKLELGNDNVSWAVTNTGLTQALAQAPNTATHFSHMMFEFFYISCAVSYSSYMKRFIYFFLFKQLIGQ